MFQRRLDFRLRDVANRILLSHDPPATLLAAPDDGGARTDAIHLAVGSFQPRHELQGSGGEPAIDEDVRPIGDGVTRALEVVERAFPEGGILGRRPRDPGLRVIVVIQVDIVLLRVKAGDRVREDAPTVPRAAFLALQYPLAVKRS